MWIAALIVLLPLILMFLPGLFIAPQSRFFGRMARIILWSISCWIIGLWLAAALQVSAIVAAETLLLITALIVVRHYHAWLNIERTWLTLAIILFFVTVYAIATVPFVIYHTGLPTGDSQKALFWGEFITSHTALPNYSETVARFNRDPVDFYTPGLHAVSGLVYSLTKEQAGTAIGMLALALSVAVACVAAALMTEVSGSSWLPAGILTFVLTLTHFRFLRYVREPGYHLQNVLGELLLFGLLLIALSLLRRWKIQDGVLAVVLVGALLLSHQFSSFIAVILLLPVAILFISSQTPRWRHLVNRYPFLLGLLLLVLILIISAGLFLGLADKIPHLFTWTPHLLSFTPALDDYPHLLGNVWLIGGLLGWFLLLRTQSKLTSRRIDRYAFVAAGIVLLLLSQGPRFGVDIPPVRALFYSIVPLSVGVSYAALRLYRKWPTIPTLTALVIFLTINSVSSVLDAYNLSHTVRTNSTLTPGIVYLTQVVSSSRSSPSQAVLVDDYERRSASWLISSGANVFTRLAADIETVMNESSQSRLRRQLYLNQLDFEKIVDFGSSPLSGELLKKHAVRWVTAIERTSNTALRYNPILFAAAYADDITLYEMMSPSPPSPDPLSPLQPWLLRSSTILNDIGDNEDTFEHLPVSLRATRLSTPKRTGNTTYRVTTAPLIPLTFNVGDYVRVLWDPEKRGRPLTALELLIQLKTDDSKLAITTPTGDTLPFPVQESILKIEPTMVPFDEDGFLTLILHNPAQQAVAIDFIALGLARTP